MALATTNVRAFQTLTDLENFIQTDTDIASVVTCFQDNSGHYVLIYTVT